LKIHIISAALPPLLDGIGDYTAHLAAELARSATVTVLAGAPTPDPIPGVHVETAFAADDPRSVWNLVGRVAEDKPDWVLLQYNPFSYGRWGLNLHLPRAMQAIKQHCPSASVAVMVHEKFAALESFKLGVMSTWQRYQFWQLGRMADILFFSIDPWTQTYRRQFPGKPVIHLAVGSNIPEVQISRQEARTRLGISDRTLVLGIFGTKHPSRLIGWNLNAIQAVCASRQDVITVYLGPDDDVIRKRFGSLPLIADGPLPAEEVSRRFQAMDIHLTPFTDGVSTRRGSLMCGLQHGVPTVGTRGFNTDGLLLEQDGKSLLLASAKNPDAFNKYVLHLANEPIEREKLGKAARAFYQQELSWEVVSGRLLQAFQSKGCV